jgi:hypothetical protein
MVRVILLAHLLTFMRIIAVILLMASLLKVIKKVDELMRVGNYGTEMEII